MKEEKEELIQEEVVLDGTQEPCEPVELNDCENVHESKSESEEEKEEEEAYEVKMTDEERAELIKGFNEQNKGKAYVDEDKPSKEEIDAVIADFVKANDEYAHMEFVIADASNSLRVAKFLKTWNEKDAVWEKDMWQGTVMFDAIIKDFIDRRQKDETLSLVINYGALSYLYLAMSNVRGVGLAAAVHQKSINEEYDAIFSVVADCVEDFKAKGKEVEKLQNIAQFYTNGFRVHFIDEPKDDHMSKEELIQTLKDHWDESKDLRDRVFANPYQFGLTKKEVDDLKAWHDKSTDETESKEFVDETTVETIEYPTAE
jgi:hypothetical protein